MDIILFIHPKGKKKNKMMVVVAVMMVMATFLFFKVKNISKLMMPFSIGLGWSVLGSLGRTKIVAGLIYRLHCRSLLQKRTRKKKGRQGLRP